MTQDAAATPHPTRIAVLLLQDDARFEDAAKFLVLQLNYRQKVFQFEFLPIPDADPLIRVLRKTASASERSVDRDGRIVDDSLRAQLGGFAARVRPFFEGTSRKHQLADTEPPACYVVVTLCQFQSRAFARSDAQTAVLALGDWEDVLVECSLKFCSGESLS